MTHDERVYHHMYETNEGIAEHAERIASLEELVRDMMQAWWACDNEKCPRHDKRCDTGKFCALDECARELGVEVDDGN